MGLRYRNRRITCATVVWSIVVILMTLTATSCIPTPTSAPPAAVPPPLITFREAPTSTTLCQAATQIRLGAQLTGVWPDGAEAEWEITDENGASLNQGLWRPAAGELLAHFPNGKVLPAGEYRLTLRLDNDVLADYAFTISDVAMAVSALELALAPDSLALPRLTDDVPHFYVRFTYEGVCRGAPYWIAVYRSDDDTICNHNAPLDQTAGTEAVACYNDDGTSLPQGTYRAELTMMDQTQRSLTFEVGTPPVTPTATPTVAPPTVVPTATPVPSLICEPLFTAAGMTAAGEPFLPQNRFEWYSQAIYAGTHCRNLSPGTTWTTQWYRNGTLTHAFDSIWQGPSDSVVWDSITGVPGAPFLLPGTYTVTFTLDAVAPLTAEFRLIPYVKPEPTP